MHTILLVVVIPRQHAFNAGSSLNTTSTCTIHYPYQYSAGTYNPNSGSNSLSACITCPPGTYQPKAGSFNCTASVSLYQCTLTSTSGISNIGSIPLLFMIPFAVVGGVIYYIRSKSNSLEVLSVSSIAFNTAVLGLDLVSDLIFVVLLLSGAFLKLTGNIYNNDCHHHHPSLSL